MDHKTSQRSIATFRQIEASKPDTSHLITVAIEM